MVMAPAPLLGATSRHTQLEAMVARWREIDLRWTLARNRHKRALGAPSRRGRARRVASPPPAVRYDTMRARARAGRRALT